MTQSPGSFPSMVVGIGASAGGLDAIQKLFSKIPGDTGLAFIIVQHLSPNFRSMMDELLSKYTPMKILTAETGMPLRPNTIYLNRRDRNILCEENSLKLVERDPQKALNLPIDLFLHSLGDTHKENAVAIILSGTGTDGSRGVRTVKEGGGLVMVQDPASSQFDGMPNAALRADVADYVGTPEEIADTLTNYPRAGEGAGEVVGDDETVDRILKAVHDRTGMNFAQYKRATLVRRIEKRMNIRNSRALTDYYQTVRDNADEAGRLGSEFLIGVTGFFRDFAAFEALSLRVFPQLLNSQSGDSTLRIWVAGCSTGEEAYSIAILLDDFIRENRKGVDFKIFATDIDRDALSRASTGVFPVNIIADIPSERLQRHFVKSGETYRIVKRVREKIVFSYHNLLTDPPFIRMDLISCRNLMIYLQPEIQQDILASMLFALNTGGILFMGSSESLGGYADHFEVIDHKWRLFKKTSDERPVPSALRLKDRKRQVQAVRAGGRNSVSSSFYRSGMRNDQIYQMLLDVYAPDCVLVDVNFNVLFTTGRLDDLIRIPSGEFSSSLLDMLEPTIAAVVRNGVRQAAEKSEIVEYSGVPLPGDEVQRSIDLRFRSVHSDGTTEAVYLIEVVAQHEHAAEPVQTHTVELSDVAQQRITDLEQQLRQANEERQNIIEELETSNEELQSSNEELLASNEELQSTNEELQSVNEELYTVNTELQTRNRELANLNTDMDNLLSSTRIGTLFLDEDLRIRQFTPELRRVFRLEDRDVGRSIHDFASHFSDITSDQIIQDAEEVMKTGKPVEREITGTDRAIYLTRVYPFVRRDETIAGAVVTLVDITEGKQVQRDLEFANSTLDHAFAAGQLAWWDWDVPDGILRFDERKARMLGYEPEEIEPTIEGFMQYVHADDHERAMQAMRDHLYGKRDVYEVEYRIRCKNGEYRWFRDRGAVVEHTAEGKPKRLIGVVFDITERQYALQAVQEQETKLRQALGEKETLLREVHHRVKNNMQKIVSLLSLQGSRSEDPDVQRTFETMKLRIFSMSLVHQMLYGSDDLAQVDLRTYLESLLSELKAQAIDPDQITIDATITDQPIDLDAATGVGLIVTELVSNALKHAFAPGQSGTISVIVEKAGDACRLVVADDGSGLPDGYDPGKARTLGLKLVDALVHQMEGELTTESDHGTRHTITFGAGCG